MRFVQSALSSQKDEARAEARKVGASGIYELPAISWLPYWLINKWTNKQKEGAARAAKGEKPRPPHRLEALAARANISCPLIYWLFFLLLSKKCTNSCY